MALVSGRQLELIEGRYWGSASDTAVLVRDLCETIRAGWARSNDAEERAETLRDKLGVMLHNTQEGDWIGRAAWRDECRAVYDVTGEVGVDCAGCGKPRDGKIEEASAGDDRCHLCGKMRGAP